MNIKDHIYILDEHQGIPIVYFKELEFTTEESVKTHFDYIAELADGNPFYLIVDPSESKPPGVKARAVLKKRYNELRNDIVFLFVIINKNFLVRVAVQFMAKAVGGKNYKFTKNIEEALAHIKVG